MSQLSIAYGPDLAPGSPGTRLPLVRLAKGGDLFDLLTPGRLTLFTQGLQGPVESRIPLRRVTLIDNHFYRPKADADQTEAQPVLREQMARLGPFARVLVRPDGYVAAIDRRGEDTAVAAFLRRLDAGGQLDAGGWPA